MAKISVVIPTMNEPAVGNIIKRIYKTLGKNTEILVVDKSTDNTLKIAKKSGAEVITQSGSGYGDAYLQGFKTVKGDIIGMLDGDGTYHPEDFKKMVEIIKKGQADIVVGNRFAGIEKGAMSFSNKLGNKFITKFTNLIYKMKIKDSQCGMRVITRKAINKMDLRHSEMPFASEMIIEARKNNMRIVQVPIKYSKRVGSPPKLKKFTHGSQIIYYSLRLLRDWNPLLLFGTMGIIFALLGISLGGFIVYQWSISGEIQRLASVVLSALLILTGVFFVGIGLMLDSIVDLMRKRE